MQDKWYNLYCAENIEKWKKNENMREKNVTPAWAQAIISRIENELPFEEDNKIIGKAVAWYLWDDLSRCKEFIGTKIIEEDYMEDSE